MYDLDILKRKSCFLYLLRKKPPVCCDAIYRLGCLVASCFALIRNVGFMICECVEFRGRSVEVGGV